MAAESPLLFCTLDSIGWTLSAGDKEYGILNDAVVFTYGDALPGEAGCRYNISTIEYLKILFEGQSNLSFVLSLDKLDSTIA